MLIVTKEIKIPTVSSPFVTSHEPTRNRHIVCTTFAMYFTAVILMLMRSFSTSNSYILSAITSNFF